MSDKFLTRLEQTNQRLKAGRVGVAVEQRGERLVLRATLPPKPGSDRSDFHQQRITLSYRANPAGLKLAEVEAKKVGALLESGSFVWTPYVKNNVQKNSVADWVERFEQDYFTRRERNPKSETTWRHDYQKVFSRLPPDSDLNPSVLLDAITATKPDTRTRKRFVDVLSRLAQFAGLSVDFKPFRGRYSPAKVSPRHLPSDQEISLWRGKIPNSQWQRAYGLLATYGIRPHELFYLSFQHFPVLEVIDGKTEGRRVYPLYPEWANLWDLSGDLPEVTGKTNSDLGNRVTHAFKRYGIPFPPYDLRHCWAVRSISFSLDISLAAAQMGHSVRVHSEIYHAWITEEVHLRAYQLILSNPNRPKAPLD